MDWPLLYSTAMPDEPKVSRGVRSDATHRSLGSARRVAACARRAFALASATLGLLGCDLGANFGDLGRQLLDPEVRGIEAPGRRWVEGPHYELNVLADAGGERYAAALNADSELVIIDFERENYCRAGKILRYDGPVSARARPSLIPILVERARGDAQPELLLTFTTFDCQRTAFAVPVTGLGSQPIGGLPDGSGSALLVRSADGGLLLVDPWAETISRVAGLVRNEDPAVAFGRFLWVDSGVIVISNDRLEPIAAIGQQVVAVTASPEDAQLAYIEAGAEEGVGGTLFTVDARGREEPREVAKDACRAMYLTLDGRRHLSYLSPCAERQLVLRDVRDDTTRIIDSDVAGWPAVRNLSGQSVLTYITTESRETSEGTLWLVAGDRPKVAIAENTRVGPSTVENGGLLAVLDWASTGGRLVQWRDDGLTEVAHGVIEIGPLGRMDNRDLTLLGNYDGQTGDLLRLRDDLSTEVLAQGVPTQAGSEDAFIANFQDGAGDLMLLDRSDGSSEPLASGVARRAFIFTQQFNAIMMLTDRDTESRTNTLRVHLLHSRREYVLHDGVTEAREVAFPSPGIIYNVVSGADAGVWFAKTL